MCCLKPPLNCANIHMLAMQIVNGNVPPLPDVFSPEIQKLVSELIVRDPKLRPNVNQILKNPLLQSRAKKFLTNKDFQEEFNHTVLHR